MQSVMNVILNRAKARGTDPYTECVRPLQFSSLTAKGDPELALWPTGADPQWRVALGMAEQATNGTLADLTGGATLYYAPASIQTTARFALPDGTEIPFPQGWNAEAVTYTATIGGQAFFRE
jgi:hypothetical protein